MTNVNEKNENEMEVPTEIIWKQILNEVSNQSSRRVGASKTLLVLGDNGSGKSNLISKLQSAGGREGDLKRAGWLQYTVIDASNEDDNIRLGTWVINVDSYDGNLLKYVVTKDSVKHLTVLLCADMSKPWNIIETLEHWYQKLHNHLNSLQLSAKEMNELERKVKNNFLLFNENIENSEERVEIRNDDNVELTLSENVLSNNIGIPIIVIVTKSDFIGTLEKENDYREEHFDFIQKRIRKFCLKTGAALVYTSSKEGTNISTLYEYMIHMIYGIKFEIIPQLVEKTSIFIPSGWDNENKIAIIDEHNKAFNTDDHFNEHIVKPIIMKPVNHEKEIVAEDEQEFLESQSNILNKVPVAIISPSIPHITEHRLSPRTQNVTQGQRSGTRLTSPQAKGKMESPKGAAENTSETVLANFFNSLLNKNTTGKITKSGAIVNGGKSEPQSELQNKSKNPLR